MSEIICGKAANPSKYVSPEKQLVKLKGLVQLPNFRIGLIIKLIQSMKQEMTGLQKHIEDEMKRQADQKTPSKM